VSRATRLRARPSDFKSLGRLEFLEHAGCRILRLDYAGLPADAVLAFMQEAREVIASQPPQTVRLLSVVALRMTEEIVAALKEFAAHNAPFVRASAIVCAEPFLRSLLPLAIKSQGRKNVEVFDDEEQAKDWLRKQ
jgi:hypothetical protein